MYVRKCKTTYSSVASCMWGNANECYYPTPPHPTPHNNVASYMWGSASERYYLTPPHPTPPQWAKKQQKYAAVYQACANYSVRRVFGLVGSGLWGYPDLKVDGSESWVAPSMSKKWGIDGSTPFKTGQLSHLCSLKMTYFLQSSALVSPPIFFSTSSCFFGT